MEKRNLIITVTFIAMATVLIGIYYNSPSTEKDTTPNELLNQISVADLYNQCIAKNENKYDRTKCLLPYFGEITKQSGTETAVLRAEELEKQGIIYECHAPAHTIGNANFEKFDGKLGEAFAACAPKEGVHWNACFEGCFHGVMEKYVEQNNDLENLMAGMSETCSGITGPRNPRTVCMHGLGHGLVRHDISKVIEAGNLCRRLTDTRDMDPCLHGVFMENMNNYISLPENELRPKINQICEPAISGKDELFKAICIQEIGLGLTAYTKNDFAKAKEFCLELSEYRKECIQKIESIEQDR